MDKEINVILQDIENALNSALPDKADSLWISSSFGNELKNLSDNNFSTLIEPNKNLIKLGGKRWRPLLMILYYLNEENKNKLPYETVCRLTPLVEFVHTASLIHDDIEDGADLRRGKPAAHITWGIDTAINSASWLYFEAAASIENQNISDEVKLYLYKLYTNELRKLHLGQALDIKWHRDSSYIPTQDEYFTMVKCKTGTLASLAASLGSVCAGDTPEKTKEVGQIAANIGIGFQIIDDVINLTTGNPGKQRGDDITEGKKSLPVILHITNNPEDKEIIAEYMKDAKQNGITSSSIEKCISLLEEKNSIKQAFDIGLKLIEENSKKLNSKEIETLFMNMIPKKILEFYNIGK